MLALLIGGYATKNLRIQKRLFRLTIVLFILFSNSFLLLECIRLWEIHGRKANKLPHYEVGIVLGGMSEFNNDLETLSIRRGADRIWQAIDLYKRGIIRKILISGDNGYLSDKGLHEAAQMKATLVSWGFPSDDIWVEGTSVNTYENAQFSAKLLKQKSATTGKTLLITSGIHMRRAQACFRHAGVAVDTYSTDLYTGSTRHYYWDQYFVPDFSNFDTWHALNKELVGYVIYAVTGKLSS